MEIGLGEGVGGVIGIDEDFLSVYQLILVVQYRINGIMHILLPVSFVGFFVFPVMGVTGILESVIGGGIGRCGGCLCMGCRGKQGEEDGEGKDAE